MLLAFFPFLIFLLSLLGFIDLDESVILDGLFFVLPGDIAILVCNFVSELTATTSAGVMSTALFFSVYNTSNGFRAIVRITNRAYGIEDRRGFAAQLGLSVMLMFLFSAALIIMLALLVFGRQIWGAIFPGVHELLVMVMSGGGAVVLLVLVVMVIYRLACSTRLALRHILPGAVFTVLTWVTVSGVFGFVMTNFTQYSAIYGSIAGVFILILWLNFVSMVLLVGNEANVLIREYFP